MISGLEPSTALRGISPVRRAILKGRADGDIRSSVETVRRASTLAELAAWQKKKLERAKAESKLRELVHTRRCDPTELFPSLARFAHAGVLILGAGQLWIPECVSARPGMPDAGFIAPAPVATWI
jgi:hypothetical protein